MFGKLLDIIIKPFRTSLYFILGMCLLRYLSNAYLGVHEISNYFAFFIDVYVISLILLLLGRRVRNTIEIIILSVSFFLNFAEVFCFKNFGLEITPFSLQLLLETNSEEANGFIDTFIFQRSTLLLLLLYSCIVLVTILVYVKSAHKDSRTFKCSFCAYYLPMIFVILLMIFEWFSIDKHKGAVLLLIANDLEETQRPSGLCYSSELRLLQSAKLLYFTSESSNRLYDTLSNIDNTVIDSCSFNCPTIVLYVGESTVKRHSQLYGYNKETNPHLVSELNSGNLFVFDNAITVKNLTDVAFRSLLFGEHYNDNWYDYPMFPSIFKLAGYRTSFISNQFQATSSLLHDFFGGFYIVDPKISKLAFDYRNEDNPVLKDDIALLDHVTETIEQSRINKNTNNLIIFQGLGMHTGFSQRYPKEDTFFTVDDYPERNDLSVTQLERLAAYDNAARYNDKVTDALLDKFRGGETIVIFVSDHGEEVYDFNTLEGRQHSFSEDIVRSEYEIPMWVWCSDLYIANHPDIVEKIKESTQKPFISDELPHLLFDIAGIHTTYYNPTLNIISDEFNTDRKRMILIGAVGNNYRNYDELFNK